MLFAVMFSYLFTIAGALMTLGLSINAIWRAIMPPAGLPRDGAACGSCGYELTTLGEGRCPECGADLLKSGVNTRHTMVRTAGSLPAALMGWTIIMIVITGVVFGVAAAVSAFSAAGGAGMTQAIVTSQGFRPDRFDRDGSGQRTRSADYQLTYTFDGAFNWNQSPQADSGTLKVEVSGPDATTPLTLEYDIETRDYTITGAGGTVIDSGRGYEAEDAEKLLGLAGLDLSDAGIAVEASQVGGLFESFLDDPTSGATTFMMDVSMNETVPPIGGLTHTGSTTNYGGGAMNPFASSSTEILILGGVTLVCGLIYVGGLIFIVRRRSKIIARPRAA